MMRWLRKNTKKILVVAGIFLMVGFLLPNFAGVGKRGQRDAVYGYVSDGLGEQSEIKYSQVRTADVELRALRILGIPEMLQKGVMSHLPSLGGDQKIGHGIDEMVCLMTRVLLFPDTQMNKRIRGGLYQNVAMWATDRQSLDALVDDINKITASDNNSAAFNYLVLAREANAAGIIATDRQINEVIMYWKAMWSSAGRPVSFAQVVTQSGLTERRLRWSIGKCLSILQYGQLVTRSLSLSEPELKNTIRDSLEIETVSGDFVTFPINLFLKKLAVPRQDDLEKHFEKYKTFAAYNITDQNEHGFGYKLDDRIEVEFLRVDLVAVSKLMEAEFKKLSAIERDEKKQEYWRMNMEEFRQRVSPTGESETDEPEFRDPPYDEIAAMVEIRLQQQHARQRGESLLLSGRDMITAGADRADFGKIANQLSNDSLKVTSEKTQFLSLEQARAYKEFSQTYRMRGKQPEQSLLQILFSCESLQEEGSRDRLDAEPILIDENIGPVLAFGQDGNPAAVYLLRVVAVDKARTPTSLADEGSFGQAENVTGEPTSGELYERVKKDYQNVQGYDLARQVAEQFAQDAQDDWKGSLAKLNEAYKEDPCQPFNPFREGNLVQTRANLSRWQEMMNNNPQSGSFWRPRIQKEQYKLQQAMVLAQERQREGASGPAVLGNPSDLSYMVLRDLSVTVPNEHEYLRHKPLMAEQLLLRKQGALVLAHFNPDNVVKRNGFERPKLDPQDEKPSKDEE